MLQLVAMAMLPVLQGRRAAEAVSLEQTRLEEAQPHQEEEEMAHLHREEEDYLLQAVELQRCSFPALPAALVELVHQPPGAVQVLEVVVLRHQHQVVVERFL